MLQRLAAYIAYCNDKSAVFVYSVFYKSENKGLLFIKFSLLILFISFRHHAKIMLINFAMWVLEDPMEFLLPRAPRVPKIAFVNECGLFCLTVFTKAEITHTVPCRRCCGMRLAPIPCHTSECQWFLTTLLTPQVSVPPNPNRSGFPQPKELKSHWSTTSDPPNPHLNDLGACWSAS